MEITEKQIEDVFTVLIAKSWNNGKDFEAYQDAWDVVSHILGVTSPRDSNGRPIAIQQVAPSPACFCSGLPGCPQCGGKGYLK